MWLNEAHLSGRQCLLVPISEKDRTISFPKKKIDNCAVCNPFLFRDGLRVNIHRALNSRVSQEFLLNLDIRTQATQQGGIGMPKHVPANFSERGACCGGPNVSPQDVLLTARSPKSISEDPFIRLCA